MKMIKVEGLTKTFDGEKAVNNLSFDVESNCIFGLLGPNGSGKTTTLRMLCTILKPTVGKIEIAGNDAINSPSKVRKSIAYVPQKDALYGNLTVKENVQFFFAAYRYEENRSHRISEVLERVGLKNKHNVLAKNLSGGMIKKLSIACAIIHDPEVVFFDEVTMGLDPSAREMIWSLARELKKTKTIIMTTHYMDEAEELCDELAILRQGKLFCQGNPKEIIHKYKAPDLEEVVASIKN